MSLIKYIKQHLNEDAGKGNKRIRVRYFIEAMDVCGRAFREIYAKHESRFPRASALGHPARRLWYMRQFPAEREQVDGMMQLTFFIGKVVEAFFVLCARVSGASLEGYQKRGSWDIDGLKDANGNQVTITGSIDYMYRAEDGGLSIRDLKTCNDRAYAVKWKNFESFAEQDHYGYLYQAVSYEAMFGVPFSGWDIVNKNYSDMKEVNVPADWPIMFTNLKGDIETKLKLAYGDIRPEKCYDDIVEEYNPINNSHSGKTGNMKAAFECARCPFSYKCFPDAVRAKRGRTNIIYTKFSGYVIAGVKIIEEDKEDEFQDTSNSK